MENIWIVYEKSNNVDYIKLIEFIKKTLKNINFKILTTRELTQDYITKNKKPSYVIYFTQNDLFKIKLLEDNNIHVLNNLSSTIIATNKIMQLKKLATKNLIPHTIFKPFSIENINSFPIMLKRNESTLGNGVFKINNKDELCKYIKKYGNEEIVLQEYFKDPLNKTTKAFVYDKKIISAYTITNNECKKIELTDKEKHLAIEAISTLELEYGSVDIIYKNEKTPYICEVNLIPNIIKTFQITGINIIQEIVNNKQKEKLALS